MLVAEPESSDNFGNNNNSIGHLTAMDRTDTMIAETQEYLAHDHDTLLMTAADSDGGGVQALSYDPGQAPPTVETEETNPTGNDAQAANEPLDGLYGRNSPPFRALPDQFGQELPFAVQWAGTSDYVGGILTRAQGRNAELLRTRFSERFDNVDVYRMLYVTAFGETLPYPQGRTAPSR